MIRRHFWLIVVLVIAAGIIAVFSSQIENAASQVDPTAPTPTQTIRLPDKSIESVERAILSEILRQQDTFVYSALSTRLERVSISADGNYASSWMILEDPSTGQIIPGEPGLALLEWIAGTWQVALPGDPEWITMLAKAPNDAMSPGERAYWLEINAESSALLPTAPISGYLLPWEGGKTANLSGSVSHDAYITSGNAHFAFDFYVPGVSSSKMFDLYASRAGTVWMYRDSQVNHSTESPGNYLVLRDTTTTPTTYQLYLHLAQNSIPPSLKSIGALVTQGQFIGVADDTGVSTGNHLHFHVHTNPASYWGKSVDITFNDVTINGGRPRVQNHLYNDEPYCKPEDICDTFQSAYISGNKRSAPSSALNLLAPVQNSTAIRLTWTSQAGADPIDHFDLQHNIDLGDWQDVVTNIPGNLSFQWVITEPEHIYAYRLRAVDVNGRVEDYPAEEETVTFVPDGSDLCASPDIFEMDNTSITASVLNLNDPPQEHNFCNTQPGNYGNDQDWIRVPVVAGQQFSAMVMPLWGGSAFPKLTLYSISGNNVIELAQTTPTAIATPVWIDHIPVASGNLYLLVQSQDGRVFGSGTGYLLYAYTGPPRLQWLPSVIHR